jgi:hypothetical protein
VQPIEADIGARIETFQFLKCFVVVTIKNVAREAGVSVGTASHDLRNGAAVRSGIRAMVLAETPAAAKRA